MLYKYQLTLINVVNQCYKWNPIVNHKNIPEDFPSNPPITTNILENLDSYEISVLPTFKTRLQTDLLIILSRQNSSILSPRGKKGRSPVQKRNKSSIPRLIVNIQGMDGFYTHVEKNKISQISFTVRLQHQIKCLEFFIKTSMITDPCRDTLLYLLLTFCHNSRLFRSPNCNTFSAIFLHKTRDLQ